MKICRNCKLNQPLSEYSPKSATCKECNRIKNRERNKKRYHQDSDYKLKQLTASKKYQIENNYYSIWRDENRDKIKKYNTQNQEYKRNWAQTQRQTNIQFRLKENIRSRIYLALQFRKDSSEEILGCSIEEYIVYLEQQFDKNMSWDNYGIYWEIDHINPISKFDLTNVNEVKICFNYKNTQPLSINENRKKGDKNII